MQPMKCPHCGAPAQIPPNTQMYLCPYCQQQFDTGYRPPQAFPQKAQQQQIIIVRGPGGHDDDDHPRSAAVASGISWLVWAIVMIFVLVIAGGGAFYGFLSKRSSFASSLVWDGKAPFQCSGNDDYAVTGVHADFNAGTAITAGGNCHFTCTDCTIKAPTAIDAAGNAQVTIVNGRIEGTEFLAEASGNARVNISGNVTASGPVKQGGNAKVSSPKPAASASASTSASAPKPAASASAPAVKKRP